MKNNLLEIKNLTVSVLENSKKKILVDHLNLKINAKSIVSLVGGSGSGKTTTALSVLGLLSPALSINSGEIFFSSGKENVLQYTSKQMLHLRGKEIGMVFQEPLYAFNPIFRIGSQIAEVLEYHTSLKGSQRKRKVLELLSLVQIHNPKDVAKKYPHQLSGGMRQRAMIAQAIAADPSLIIADEPTSNLDVTLQAKILELFKKLKRDLGLSILLITHDLGIVAHLSDEMAVMSQGVIVERGKVREVLNNPKDPYTRELLSAI